MTTDPIPMDYIRATATALGLDPDRFMVAARAHMDQAQAWHNGARPVSEVATTWPVCPDCYESDVDHCGECWCCDDA